MSQLGLQEVAMIHGGGRLKLSGNHFVPDGFPAFGAGGINGFVATAEYVDREAVILSSIGARCGKCFYTKGAWTSLANTQVILPDPSQVDARFLWYQLNDETRWPRSGSAQPFIKPSDVKTHRVWLPALDEQRRIAAILDQVDALRAKRRLVLALLDELNQANFDDIFDAVDDALVAPLADLATVSSGITKGRKVGAVATRPMPYLAVSNVQDGHLKLDVVKEMDVTDAEIEKYSLAEGDLVLTEGGDPDKLGRGTVWRSELPHCLHQNHIFRVRPHPGGQVTADYLSAYMASRAARSYFLKSAKQTTGIASINMSQLKALPVAVPHRGLQETFSGRLDAGAATRQRVQRHSELLDETFASLKRSAFLGHQS